MLPRPEICAPFEPVMPPGYSSKSIVGHDLIAVEHDREVLEERPIIALAAADGVEEEPRAARPGG